MRMPLLSHLTLDRDAQSLEDLRKRLAVQLAASSACIDTLEKCNILESLAQMKSLQNGARLSVGGWRREDTR